jgi:hypothetical protein
LDDFRPIEPNPYIVGNPIRDRAMFFGRQEDLRFLHDRLDTAGREMVVLCGGRRCGKTSILLQVLDGRLGERFVTVLVDMQQLAELRRDGDLWAAVARRIVDRMKEKKVPTEGLVAPPGDVEEPHAVFRRFLEAVAERLGKRKLVILVDEYELIEEHIHHGTLTNDTTLVMAALLDSALPVSFLFTGSRRVQERDPAVWSRLMGKAIHRRVSFLALGDAERLIREPVRGRMDYGDDAVHAILRLTAGHPFYTQVVCQSLVDRLNEKRRGTVEVEDVDAVAEALADSPLPQMVYWWKSMPLLSRVVGSLLASNASAPQAYVPAATIEADLEAHRREYGFEARRASVRGTLERLLEEEELEAGDPRDTYRFRMDIIRRWLRVEHPVWEVIRDLSTKGTDLEGIRPIKPGGAGKWIAVAAALVLLAAGAVTWMLLPPAEDTGSAGPAAGREAGTARLLPDGASVVMPAEGDAAGTARPAVDGADAPPVPETLRYAKAFALRRQIPTPLGEIAAEDLAGRIDYFVFAYQGERLVRLEHRNGSGLATAPQASDDEWWEGATTFVPEYRQDGSVERLTALRCGTGKAKCMPLAVQLVGRDLRSRRAVVPGREELATWNEDRIAIFGTELGADGFSTQTRYLNALGKPQPDRLGRVKVERKRDADGWVVEEREEIQGPASEDDEGEGVGAARKATRVVRVQYDARHNQLEVAAFDGGDRPVRFPEESLFPGVHRVVRTWDERDRPILERYFGPNGEPTPLGRCYALRLEYDAKGNPVRDVCLGSDDQPCPDEDDVMRTEVEYDALGRPLLERSVGRGELPARETVRMEWDDAGNKTAERTVDETIRDANGRPIVLRARAYEYDERGRMTAQRNLDADGKPIAPLGFAAIRWTRDVHGQVLTKGYEGLDGKPAASGSDEYRGVAVVSYEYDDYGFLVARRFTDVRDRPVNSPYQAAEVRWKVDALGRILEEREKPAPQRPPIPDAQWPDSRKRTWRYDAEGNVIEERAYGVDGKPVPAVTGELIVRREFDHLNRPTAEWYLDAEELPMVGGTDQVAKLTRTFAVLGPGDACWADADGKVRCTDPQTTGEGPGRGTVVETRFYDQNDRPTWSAAHGRGIVRVVSVKDAEGHVLEMRYFDADDRPAANRQGYHTVRTRWSPAGPIDEVYLGPDGMPVEAEIDDGLRCARRTWTYDEHGNAVEYRTLGVDGTPRADADGIAARLRRFDGENALEEQYLDAAGEPRAGATGVARAIWEYDAAGHPTREAFFDASGAPFVPPEWVSDLAARYDEFGRLVHFELAPPLRFGDGGDMLAAVDVNYQGANALAVPLGPGGQHIVLEGIVAMRYPKAEWGERTGCVGVDGERVACAEGTEVLLSFLSAPRSVSCSSGAAGAGDGRCEWIWSM